MKCLLGKHSRSLVLGVFLGALLGATNVYATPVSIDIGSFSGSETVIDFNTIADEELPLCACDGQCGLHDETDRHGFRAVACGTPSQLLAAIAAPFENYPAIVTTLVADPEL